ncbi:MAG: uroporphyrinogen decarboxylase family protein [Verrucomicrobiae bacterium]|nr:uroporphyrinogen decarboxylase family protein [Verrucomicrobiae bacterium]
MAALSGKISEPVWLEMYLNCKVASSLAGYNFTFDWGYNGAGIDEHLQPVEKAVGESLERWRRDLKQWLALIKKLGIGAISMCFYAPVFVEMKTVNGRQAEGHGLIHSLDDLRRRAGQAPDPLDDSRYDLARELIETAHGEGLAVFFNSSFILEIIHRVIGFERFCMSLYEERDFLDAILDYYFDYEKKLLGKLSSLKPDFIWISDDAAYKSGPYISPAQYREVFIPYYQKLARQITVPWILHSDGNIDPLVEDMLSLGMNALHPMEKGAVDLPRIAARYGQRVTLVGNIEMDLLQRGSPEQIGAEVRLVRDQVKNARHIYASGNCLVEGVRPENVTAMSEAIKKIGG